MSDDQKFPSQLAERFQIRLPPGLRDRIKAYAELQGRSMNTEIVRVLENEFPEPEGIERRVSNILGLVAVLKAGADRGHINRLSNELLDTVRAISDGTIRGVDEATRDQISQRLHRWEEDFAEDEAERSTESLDQVKIEALSHGRSTAKYPLDREWRRHARSVEGHQMTEEEEDASRRWFDAGYKYGRSQTQSIDLDDENEK